MDEFSGLVMNIVLPASPSPDTNKKYPVLVYVHGGSLLYGGANLPIFDAVNLVSHSLKLGKPIVCANFNYRVGLGGFLASNAIRKELQSDGFDGCGNFGFTDQQVAFDWVQHYISYLGGDPSDVTAVGESAGGISISNQMLAATPPVFHRAVCMSGLAAGIPAWTMEQHEQLFRAVCRHFHIDPASDNVLDLLRGIPQQVLANATPDIQGVFAGTGNACLDGWFYGPGLDPRGVHPSPHWIEGFMLGDVFHEGVIFHINLVDDSYDFVRSTLLQHVKDGTLLDLILREYEITPSLPHGKLLEKVEHMAGDILFKIPNYATMLASRTAGKKLWTYHFDQRSRIRNSFEGTAYHAHELLYLFGNLDNEFNDAEREMAREFASAWIRFVYGEEPWEVPSQVSQEDPGKWMVWGPDCVWGVKTEEQDEEVRRYTRIKKMLALGNGETWKLLLNGVDALVNKRMRMGQ